MGVLEYQIHNKWELYEGYPVAMFPAFFIVFELYSLVFNNFCIFFLEGVLDFSGH